MLVAASNHGHQFDWSLSPIDPADLANMHATGTPFYAATDYRPAPAAPPTEA